MDWCVSKDCSACKNHPWSVKEGVTLAGNAGIQWFVSARFVFILIKAEKKNCLIEKEKILVVILVHIYLSISTELYVQQKHTG